MINGKTLQPALQHHERAADPIVLSVTELSKNYGSTLALDGVGLEIKRGEILHLLGRNGAGKTTFVSIVAGLCHADRGRAIVAGHDVAREPGAAREHIGLVPQDLGIYPMVTVRENLSLFGVLADVPRFELRARIAEIAEVLDLTSLLDRRARFLSGGEKRRLHMAIALLRRPTLLLLDEPTAGVDVVTRERVLQMVERLAYEGTAICYCTHYLPEVERLGGVVVILEAGRVLVTGTIDELVQRYGQSFVELGFTASLPPTDFGQRAVPAERSVRVFTDSPGAEVASLVRALGDHSASLTSVDIVRPSLENVFFAVSGQRLQDDTSPDDPADF